MKRVLKWLALVVLGACLIFVIANWNSWDDGILYLQDMAAYRETPAQPLNENGRFGFCKQFVTLRNAQRAQFIENYLDARGIKVQRLPIYDTKFDNLFVPLHTQGNESRGNETAFVPYTIYSAHYDKVLDQPDYQGASDNSAAVCMLLVAAEELTKQKPNRPIAFLFTGEEEIGLVGAKAFYEYAMQNGIPVAQVLNFDSMGRAGIAARASGERSGFVFTIPLLGEFVYDGRELTRASAYRQPDAEILKRVGNIVPLAYFDRMVAKSDGTYFQDQGWNAVTFTSDDIYYLDVTWHTFRDRVELLDESNFERAVELMLGYAQVP